MSTNEKWLRPPRLREGSRVALVAPAGPLSEERISLALERCRAFGLEPVLGAAARNRRKYLAGTDAERTQDLQNALSDPAIDAVWALRGGYGTARLLPFIDFAQFRSHPKAYIGFSDNTTIHLAFFDAGIVSFHGPHPGGDFPAETADAFERVLFDASAPGQLPLRANDPSPRTLRGGKAAGPLVGGNLSILAAACGTGSALQARGCILFVEEIGEAAYRIDRALMQLFNSGALDGVKGIACGRFTDQPADDLDYDIADILLEFAERMAVPAAIDFPIGHIEHNWTIPLGVAAELDADKATLEILDSAVCND